MPQRITIKEVIDLWRRAELPGYKYRTQIGYECYLTKLHMAFGNLTFEQVTPVLVNQYRKKRSAKVSANREISLLSKIWDWARSEGYTLSANQCVGLPRNKEKPRSRYVTDEEFRKAWESAPEWLKDILDLCLCTGQRIGDVLSLTRQDIKDGHIYITQAKTGARVNVRVQGRLQTVLERILARPRPIPSMYLICDKDGQPYRHYRVWYAFRKTGAKWRIHDIRAKTASDMYERWGIAAAQELAGHQSQRTTESVYVRIRGKSVKPLD